MNNPISTAINLHFDKGTPIDINDSWIGEKLPRYHVWLTIGGQGSHVYIHLDTEDHIDRLISALCQAKQMIREGKSYD